QLTNTQLDTIIENMNNMIAHQEQQTTCMYNILNELGMLNQYNEDVKALIEELLVEVQAGHLTLEELLNQMNQLDANVALGFVNVLNAMQNLSPTSHEHLVHLLEQILAKITEGNNNNNANAAEILAALQNLSGQIGNLNTNVQTGIFNILAAIAGLNGGIEELKPILNAILTMINTMDQNQQQAYVDQMEVLTTIMQNQTEGLHFLEIIIGNQNVQINQLTQIITLLNSIKAKCDQINVKFDDVLAILNEIQCDDCCETIIILLQELLNHEGIIDDPFWENPDSNVYGLFHP
ncbi:MAG: hypothetical protein MJ237_02980, partial [bacterium]|nr:hypothetical protein [bacterium]